jgi:hypothetical protein
MMNILQIQDTLKGMPMEQLIREMQMPSGQAPQFLVLSEITRRKKMEQEAQQPAPTTTVAQDAVNAAGVPQGGIADIARSMAPKTDVAQNTGIARSMPQMPSEPSRMADGGYVQKMQVGGPVVRGGMQIAPEYPLEGAEAERAEWTAQYGQTHNWDGRPKEVRTWGQRNIGDPLRSVFKPIGDAGKAAGAAFMEDAPRFKLGGIPINAPDVPEVPAQLFREPEPYMPPTPTLEAPSVEEVMEQFGVNAEDAQSIIDRTYGPRLGREGSSFVVTEAPPAGTVPAEPLFLPGQFAPFLGSEEEYQRALAEKAARRAAMVEETATPTPAELPMDTGADLPVPDGGIADLMPPAAKKQLVGAGGAGMSALDQEIMDMLQRREKAAEQNKWLALAQAGMALMSSKQPTFGGALGEAGLAGISQLQSGRSQYDKDRLELLTLQENSRLAREKMAAPGAGLTPYQAAMLARGMRSDLAGELNNLIELRKGLEDLEGKPLPAKQDEWDNLTAQINSRMTQLYGVGSAGDTGGVDYVVSGARTGG